MKVWGVIATILFLASAAAGGWLYFENTNLKTEINSTKLQKEEEANKINTALERVDTLGYFAENYLAEKQNPDEMTELANKITDIGDRNLQVAYESLKQSSAKEERTALQNFFTEFLRVITETLGGKVNISEESSTQSQSSEKNQKIEGEGEYSENVFPKS